jgi:murein L,D-transpeptidase YcbB/YkuD
MWQPTGAIALTRTFACSASAAALIVALSSGTFATTDNASSPSGAPPSQAAGEAGAPATTTDKPAAAPAAAVQPALPAEDRPVADKLRELIEGKLRQHVTREQDRAGVEGFYRERGFAPLWIAANAPKKRAKDAIAFLRGIDADGLTPADYPAPKFSDSDPERLAADELRLTNSILTYVRHASTGRVAFSRASGSVYFDLKAPEANAVLTSVAASADIARTLDGFNPQHAAYKALKAQLAAARENSAKRDSVQIPGGPLLRPGANDARVPLLRKRLKLAPSESENYGDELVEAVKAFQTKAGLNADGVVGAGTLASLNGESSLDRTSTIVANMERWRWLPRELGATHVMVNVPDYRLTVVKDGATAWSTRIVVGKPGTYATPLLTETMKFITVNPTWNVPPSIIRNEYLPALQRDPNALARIGLRIGHNADGSLRIYQPPGERNALGRIRFNFPNRFLVYQHDTPDKHLFEKTARAFSHGCMRVQNPDQYAEVLLSISQPEDGYNIERIRALYGKGERTINFKNPIPVHVTYQTAFVDDAGQLQIRPDVYGLDKDVVALLNGDRRIADVPMARNYSSGGRPVVAQASRRWRDGPDDFGFGNDGWGWRSEYRAPRYNYSPFGRFRSW